MTAFFELAMCILVDQVKSLPAQFVLWWVVIRRLGKLEPADFTEWDDQEIWEGGVQMSLYELIRFKIRTFLENKYIYGLILGMTFTFAHAYKGIFVHSYKCTYGRMDGRTPVFT